MLKPIAGLIFISAATSLMMAAILFWARHFTLSLHTITLWFLSNKRKHRTGLFLTVQDRNECCHREKIDAIQGHNDFGVFDGTIPYRLNYIEEENTKNKYTDGNDGTGPSWWIPNPIGNAESKRTHSTTNKCEL